MATTAQEAFFTRGQANEGIQLPLYTPDGRKSEHWVRIIGVDSDRFREAETESRREAFQVAQIEDVSARAQAVADSKRRLIAVLVVAWSFETPCTVDTVADFFKEAPQIMDAIDVAASKRALFFGSRSNSSQPLPSTSSGST